jgi:hypothetical protein
MAGQHRVAARGVQLAVGLDHQLVARQRAAAIERQRTVDDDLARDDDADGVRRDPLAAH